MTSQTMTAATRSTYGGPEAITVASVAIPEPKAGEVLVEVRAAGVDQGVWHLLAGKPKLTRLAFGLRRPKDPSLGFDLAGVVVSVSPDVTRFAPGDEVFGIGQGTFAQFACAPESKLAKKPASISFEEASVVPISGLTGLQAVRDQAKVEPGQHVAITGASGGVGSYAVQVAKSYGAIVTAICSEAKAAFVSELGADHFHDYRQGDVASIGTKFDAIIDIAGNTPLTRLRQALTQTGTAVITGGEGGGDWLGGIDRQGRAMIWSPFIKQRLCAFVSSEDGADIEALGALINSGQLKPALERTFPLSEAAAAITYMRDGHVRGKVALTITN